MVTPIARAFSRASQRLAWVEMLACKVLIVLFTIVLVVNVTLRYGFGSPLYYAEELAVYILIWMAFLAMSVSLHENTQIRLTLLTHALPERVGRFVVLVMDGLAAVMLAVILVHALTWIQSPSVEFELAITLGIGKKPFFAIIPLFCATGLFHMVARLIQAAVVPREAE